MKNILSCLCSDTLLRIFSFMSIPEHMVISITCKLFRELLLQSWQLFEKFTAEIDDINVLKPVIHMPNLRIIDLSKLTASLSVGDRVLLLIARICSQLESINLSTIVSVTNVGIKYLAENCLYLNYVDITFCSNVDYRAVLILRGIDYTDALLMSGENVPRPIVVRRQPRCIDGHFICPWTPQEIHTYYPDGSFQFSRNIESRGWVTELLDRGGHFVDKLHYVNGSITDPSWEDLEVDSGVLIKVVASDEVLIVQSFDIPDQPDEFPDIREIGYLPVGTCTHVVTKDNILILVSRMRLLPLQPDEMIPPAELTLSIAQWHHRCSLRHSNEI